MEQRTHHLRTEGVLLSTAQRADTCHGSCSPWPRPPGWRRGPAAAARPAPWTRSTTALRRSIVRVIYLVNIIVSHLSAWRLLSMNVVCFEWVPRWAVSSSSCTSLCVMPPVWKHPAANVRCEYHITSHPHTSPRSKHWGRHYTADNEISRYLVLTFTIQVIRGCHQSRHTTPVTLCLLLFESA